MKIFWGEGEVRWGGERKKEKRKEKGERRKEKGERRKENGKEKEMMEYVLYVCMYKEILGGKEGGINRLISR